MLFRQLRVDSVAPRIPGTNQHVAIRFRSDQREYAKMQLDAQCFLRGWEIPAEHWAFTRIDQRTWEPVK